MDLGLNGMRAAITGGVSGLGRAIAELLVAEGCNVSICGAEADPVEHSKRDLSRDGVAVTGGIVDLADPESLHDWIEATASQFGGLELFIPILEGAPLGDTTPAVLGQRVISSVVDHMGRSGGRIVIVAIGGDAGQILSFRQAALAELVEGQPVRVLGLPAGDDLAIAASTAVFLGSPMGEAIRL